MANGGPGFIKGRSTTDLLILMIATTICISVLAAGATIALVKLKNPGADISTAYKSVQDVINTLIGLLAGFLAGRTESTRESRMEARRTRDDLESQQDMASDDTRVDET